jgi:preprotein translocase subunit SecE
MSKHRKNKPTRDAQGQPGEGQATGQATGQAAPAQPLTLAKKAAPPAAGKLKPKREQEEVKPPNKVMRFIGFLRDARRELTRVTWPTRKETITSTGVLLALVAIAALYLFVVDNIINLAVVDGLRELLVKIVFKLKL